MFKPLGPKGNGALVIIGLPDKGFLQEPPILHVISTCNWLLYAFSLLWDLSYGSYVHHWEWLRWFKFIS